MKNFLLFGFLLGILLVGNSSFARIVTLTTVGAKTNDMVTVGTNEVLTLLSAGGTGLARFYVEKDGTSHGNWVPYNFDPGTDIQKLTRPLIIAGPAKLTLTTGDLTNAGPSFVTVEIQPDQFPPDKTLIVPEGTGANIVLEASTNLINWSAASPGLYTNRTGNLFFRIRADRVP